jgi:hypothetical protein
MREGPLADLFRKTEEAAEQAEEAGRAAEREQVPAPSTPAGERRRAPEPPPHPRETGYPHPALNTPEQEPPPAPEAIRTAAQAASWALPKRVAVLVAADTAEAGPPQPDASGGEPLPGEEIVEATATRLARRIGVGAIGGAAGGLACVFVPDPDAPGRKRQIAAALSDGPAIVSRGPTVPWTDAAASLRRAAGAYRLAAAGRIPAGLVVAEDHLATLLLASDAGLAADLAASRLAPLAGLGDGPRARLTETLRAWLDRPGQVQAVAAELDVHPQTVRYRLRQLRELFGARLDDPEARFELALALRVG